jgi:hypothetical protein
MRWIASAVAVAALTACGSVEPQAPANTSVAVPALSEIPRNTTRPATGDSDMRLLEPFTGDLEVLMERGVIRVLAASSRTHFEVDGSMQRGRTVDAAAAFEQFVNQRLAPRKITVVVLPAAEASLINDVRAGQGDIAANVLRTFERDGCPRAGRHGSRHAAAGQPRGYRRPDDTRAARQRSPLQRRAPQRAAQEDRPAAGQARTRARIVD